jgi:hypothetical protein
MRIIKRVLNSLESLQTLKSRIRELIKLIKISLTSRGHAQGNDKTLLIDVENQKIATLIKIFSSTTIAKSIKIIRRIRTIKISILTNHKNQLSHSIIIAVQKS